MHIDDDELVYVAKRNNPLAFKLLEERYLYHILYWCSVVYLDKGIKKYAISMCYQLLYRCIDRYQFDKGVFYAFYRESCLNYLKSLYNEQKLRRRNEITSDDLSNYSFTYILNDSDSFDLSFMDELNMLEKRIIDLRIDGYTYNEITKQLDIDNKKIDNTLTKVRKIYKNKAP